MAEMFPPDAEFPDIDAVRTDREELKAVLEQVAEEQYDAARGGARRPS